MQAQKTNCFAPIRIIFESDFYQSEQNLGKNKHLIFTFFPSNYINNGTFYIYIDVVFKKVVAANLRLSNILLADAEDPIRHKLTN